eukprot:CAMPEP_0174261462 /NCGR_PEP_ID=MMETSP0439-20130205/11447_1 /TAXON_ID=0 /ORGANISM="Stereomyxa ramosa, Strain Chinc5" /LENGTH=121 /DNA_ID=CAMNT_0015345943 /DNA_START=18 /DNA_END=380 /DNA_ORIENTATION=-
MSQTKQEIRHQHLNRFGRLRAGLEDEIDAENQRNADRADDEDLFKYKVKFLEIDSNGSGDLDAFELLSFLNRVGMKDGGKAWTEPSVTKKVIQKYGDGRVLRYAGFLRMILGDDMGRVLRL